MFILGIVVLINDSHVCALRVYNVPSIRDIEPSDVKSNAFSEMQLK